jgi:ribosome biogenesis GTPase
MVADTPGLEFFSLWGVTPENLADHFPDFDTYRCGFTDCRHRAEPRCAVKAAVEAGAIRASRYESYLAIGKTL